MPGSLTKKQCERVLLSEKIGHIGCHHSGKVYVVPLMYVFENGYIYAQSKEGLKVSMMRKNPKVCFQIDQIDDMTNWRSVILWGEFEELTQLADKEQAIQILKERFEIIHNSSTVKPIFNSPDVLPHKERRPVIYRITINEITGRFERSEE